MDAAKLARLITLQSALEAALGAQDQLSQEGLEEHTVEATALLELQLEGVTSAISGLLGSDHLRALGLTEIPSRRVLMERRDAMLELYAPGRFESLPARYRELAANDRREVEEAFAELMAALYGPEAPGSAELDALALEDDEGDAQAVSPDSSEPDIPDSIVFLLEGKNRPLTLTELARELSLSYEDVVESVLDARDQLAVPLWPYVDSVGLPSWSNLLQRVAGHSWEQLRTRLLPEKPADLGREQWLAILNEAESRNDRDMIRRAQRFFEV